MAPKYSYLTSTAFINNLEFDYMEAFSFQRSFVFEENNSKELKEYERLKNRLREFTELSSAEISEFERLKMYHESTHYIVNSHGEFHPSAEKTGTFDKKSPVVEKLRQILNTPIKTIPSWMCGPTYRDAIVFYDSRSTIVATLNVCLSCEYMETSAFNFVNSDQLVYRLLRDFFVEIGHSVEQH